MSRKITRITESLAMNQGTFGNREGRKFEVAVTKDPRDRLTDLSNQRISRWANELNFFESRESDAAVSETPEGVIRRYKNPKGNTALEHCFKQLGIVAGKRVLDVCCGSGSSSTLLAKLGAQVLGVDLSPKLIQAADRRSILDGVSDHCCFICSPLELIEFDENSFDVIWCEASLHHLIPELSSILELLVRWVTPHGIIIINEPVNHADWLRSLRLVTPVQLNGTDGERPIKKNETLLILSKLRNSQTRYFRLFTRLERVLFEKCLFEHSKRWKKVVFRCLVRLDRVFTRIPLICSLGSVIVICGHPKK